MAIKSEYPDDTGRDLFTDWSASADGFNPKDAQDTWRNIKAGGGVGIGYSQHAGQVIVADGTPEAAKRIERVLWNDPATGVMRHADAGYQEAIDCAREKGLNLPSL
mgnify:CR=1 FL=1